MYTVKRKAYAKINLMLNVLGKRPDGYHDLETVMQAVSLCDEITVAITPREGGAGDSYGRAGYGCGGAGLAPLAKGGMAPATSPPLPKGGWRQQDLRRQGGLVCDGGGVGGAGDAGVVQTPIERLARILAGSIRITINSSDAYITSQLPSIPTDARNTVHKAVIEYFKLLTSKNYARLAKEPYAPLETINNRISISIDKMIPAAAGLGGGSSDAAAVLLALNDIVGYAAKNVGERGGLHGINSGINSGINGGLNGVNGGINGGINGGLFNRAGGGLNGGLIDRLPGIIKSIEPLSADELNEAALHVGADVPFCLRGGAAFATGIGERLHFINPVSEYPVVLANPRFELSTKWVFDNYILPDNQTIKSLSKIIHTMIESSGTVWDNCVNSLETAVANRYPQILKIKDSMINAGALCAAMSGSGPTVFGLFNDRDGSERAAAQLRAGGYWTAVCNMAPGDVRDVRIV